MREGVVREAHEEIGITIRADELDFQLVQHRWCDDPGNPHARIGFYFIARSWIGEPSNMEPNKCDDLTWFPLDELPGNTIGHVRAAIDSYRKGLKYSEYEWPER